MPAVAVVAAAAAGGGQRRAASAAAQGPAGSGKSYSCWMPHLASVDDQADGKRRFVVGVAGGLLKTAVGLRFPKQHVRPR